MGSGRRLPNLIAENVRIHKVAYGVYHPNYEKPRLPRHGHQSDNTEPFNRGHDDLSVQYGALTWTA